MTQGYQSRIEVYDIFYIFATAAMLKSKWTMVIEGVASLIYRD